MFPGSGRDVHIDERGDEDDDDADQERDIQDIGLLHFVTGRSTPMRLPSFVGIYNLGIAKNLDLKGI